MSPFPIERDKAGVRVYAEYDANWDITSLVNSSSTPSVLERFDYDPYGKRTVLTATWGSGSDTQSWVYSFQGGRLDTISGLIHFQARDLNTSLGRWMQEDPAGMIEGSNTYLFEQDTPPDRTDALGLRSRRRGGDLSMDEPGYQILTHYLGGSGEALSPDGNTDPVWKDYMQADEILRSDMVAKLKALPYAEYLSFDQGTVISIPLDRFHEEIENGEEIVGYEYLHGSNANAGDFTLEGNATVVQKTAANCGVIQLDIQYQWNDIIKPNFMYQTDQIKSKIGKAISFGHAKDYQIHIHWKETTTVTIENGKIVHRTGWPYEMRSYEPPKHDEGDPYRFSIY